MWRQYNTMPCINLSEYWTTLYKLASFALSHEQHDDAILNSRKLRMRYPLQFTGRPISHWNEWSFGVNMIPLRNSRCNTTTGVNSGLCDSRWLDILRRWTFAGAKVALVSCKHPPYRLSFVVVVVVVFCAFFTYSEQLTTLEGLRKTQLKISKIAATSKGYVNSDTDYVQFDARL